MPSHRKPPNLPLSPLVSACVGALLLPVAGRLEGGRASYYDRGQIAAPFDPFGCAQGTRRLRAGCAEIGVETYVPRPKKGSAEAGGRFGREQFACDAAADTCRCPAGQTLPREVERLKRGEPHIACANPQACASCPLKEQCTKAAYRRITRWEGEAIVEAMHARVAAHPEMIAQRKTLVEHPFGSIKFWQEQRAFMMKGLEKVRGEFNLSALAYNMKRVINIVGMERLLEAVRRLVAAAARLLEAVLDALSARWHPNEAEWPLAA